jgi:aquaporin Z
MSNEIYARSAPAGDVVVLIDEPATLIPPLGAKLGAELLGTFWLVLAGVSLALFADPAKPGFPSALAFGLAFMTGAYALAHISGAHFNPAVTIGTAIAGKTPWRDVLPYIIAQVVGGALAALAIFVIIKQHPSVTETRTPFESVSNVWQNGANPGFGFAAALIVEFIVAAVFLAVVLGATDKRASIGFAPVAIGLAYALAIQIATPITGGSVNPARSTATAIFATGSAAGQLWLFWLAPILGAAFAGFIYKAFQVPAGTSFTEMVEDDDDDSELDDGELDDDELDDAELDDAELDGGELDGGEALDTEGKA